ncbi:delta-60 repeat domain-containing protein [Pseudomonas sp. H11T01]|uniref:delta-60 repeat domain-containing protein n=1 Tax=Pseudomonas sp. H11T01 TaxID=3402749 RepID=UPI003AD5024B
MSTQNTSQSPRKSGELDASFGDNGTTLLEGSEVKALAVLKAPGADQGKIIGVISTASDFILFRLEKDGVLDPTFGTTGYSRWGFGNTSTRSVPASITVLSDNKIFVAGHAQEGSIGGNSYPAAARFNVNGSPDLTFGVSGVFSFREQPPTAGNTSAPYLQQTSAIGNLAVVETNEDGKILFCSNNTIAPYRDWGLLIQLTSTGELDTTFNGQGYAFFKLNGQPTSSIGLVTQKTSGRIIVGGTTATQSFLAGFTNIGKTDTSFGEDGLAELKSDTAPLTLSKLLLQSDEKPVAIGRVPTTGSSRKGYVTRTLPNGKTDSTFNNGLPLTIDRPLTSLQLNSGDLDSGQSIIVAGELNTRGLSLVGRITKDGTLDPTFGTAGLSNPSEPGTPNYTTSAVVQTDTQIVIAGRKDSKPSVSRYQA